jgi:hypothetical protein
MVFPLLNESYLQFYHLITLEERRYRSHLSQNS